MIRVNCISGTTWLIMRSEIFSIIDKGKYRRIFWKNYESGVHLDVFNRLFVLHFKINPIRTILSLPFILFRGM